MKSMNELLKRVTITSLAISFVSFGIAVIGGLIDSSILIMFWYVGLTAIWVILAASIVASAVFLFDSAGKWYQQQNFYQLKEHRHHPPHAAV
jgi:hypothetical protein